MKTAELVCQQFVDFNYFSRLYAQFVTDSKLLTPNPKRILKVTKLSSLKNFFFILIDILQTDIYIKTFFKKTCRYTKYKKNKTCGILDPTLKKVIVYFCSSAAQIYK